MPDRAKPASGENGAKPGGRSAEANISAVAQMEQQYEQQRTPADRAADAISAIVTSAPSLLLHVGVLITWVLWNTGRIPGVRVFDPFPFSMLGTWASTEALLVALFVLRRQTRMGRKADHRAHLDLQIDLLAEKEVTKTLQMLEAISRRLGVDRQAVDPEVKELSQLTAVDELATELKEKLPQE